MSNNLQLTIPSLPADTYFWMSLNVVAKEGGKTNQHVQHLVRVKTSQGEH